MQEIKSLQRRTWLPAAMVLMPVVQSRLLLFDLMQPQGTDPTSQCGDSVAQQQNEALKTKLSTKHDKTDLSQSKAYNCVCTLR